MMKRRYLVLLIVIAAMLPLSVSAETRTGKCGDNLKWTLDGNGVLTIAGTGKMYDYEYFEDKNGVESNNIPWGHEIRQVKIQQGVTSIGNFAFEFCKYLTIITIPNSITSVGEYAFDECSSLTSITMPDSITTIGEAAFFGCISLENIRIPYNVTSIGDFAFLECYNLTKVTIPNSVTSIGIGAFQDCSNITIICNSNSKAKEYAVENKIPWQDLSQNSVITSQPSSVTVNEGKKATFKVAAIGAESYQWYCRTSSSKDWKKVSKIGDSDTLHFKAQMKNNGYQFYCLIKTDSGSISSQIVTLTVTPENAGNSSFMDNVLSRRMPNSVYYSTNDKKSVKNGNKGVYSYDNDGNVYYIIDLDNGYVYRFVDTESSCEKVKIDSGSLNDTLLFTYHEGKTKWTEALHFSRKNQPNHLILEDNDHFEWDLYPTDLEDALREMEKKKIVDY